MVDPDRIKQEQQDADCITCPNPFSFECTHCEIVHEAWGSKSASRRQYYLSFNFIRARYYRHLSKSAILVFEAIRSRVRNRQSDPNYGKCWISISDLKKETGLSERSINRGVQELQSHDLIERTLRKRKDKSGNWTTSNEWTLPYMIHLFRMEEWFRTEGKNSLQQQRKKSGTLTSLGQTDHAVEESPTKKTEHVQYNQEEEKRLEALGRISSVNLRYYLQDIKDKLRNGEMSERDYYHEERRVNYILEVRDKC